MVSSPLVPEEPLDDGSPELKTVLTSIRSSLGGSPATIAEDPDWNHVYEIAFHNGVTPLLYEGLRNGNKNPPILDKLKKEIQRNARHNFALARELVAIHDDLEQAGVEAIPYKGPVLAVEGYGDLGSRVFRDLDILVRPSDLPEACEQLQERGYEPIFGFKTLEDVGIDPPVLSSPKEIIFRHPNNDRIVELRWALGSAQKPLALGFDDLWTRRSMTALGEKELPTLSDEDRVLILSNHGVKHAWLQLKWVTDVAAVLSASQTRTEALLDYARAYDSTVPLAIAIVLVASLFGDATDRSLRRCAFSNRRAGLLANRARSRLVTMPLDTSDQLGEPVYDILATESVIQMPSIALKSLVQPNYTYYEACPLPRPLWPLYIPMKLKTASTTVVRQILDRDEGPPRRE